MAKSCSRCGKQLSFRDSFSLDGKPVCKSCLHAATGSTEAKEIIQKKDEVKPDDMTTLRKNLKTSGIGSIVFGIIAIVLGGATVEAAPINGVLIFLGIFLLAEGIWLIVSPRPVGLIVDGVALIFIGIWNFIITIQNAQSGGGNTFFGVVGVMQIVSGIQSFRRYGKIKHIQVEKPAGVQSATGAKFYSDFFDPSCARWNIHAGIFYLIGVLFSEVFWPLLIRIFEPGIHFAPLVHYLWSIPFQILEAGLLVVLSHKIRDEIQLPIFFGIGLLVFNVLHWALVNLIGVEGFSMQFQVIQFLIRFAWGFCILFGVVKAVRLKGMGLWSMALGFAAGSLAARLITDILYAIQYKGFGNFGFMLAAVFTSVLAGLIRGALLYCGLTLGSRKKVDSIQKG